jgi:putative cell wall-binding protein
MASRIRRLVSAVMVLAVVLAFTPAASLAASRTAGRTPRRVRPRSLAVHKAFAAEPVTTFSADPFDSADDTATGARNLTAYVAGTTPPRGFGKASFEETHTFSVASNETAFGAGDYAGDQDWFRFDVTQADVDMAKPYLIEAHASDLWVDPAIEVYGPTTTDTVAAADPATLVDASGAGQLDPSAVAADDNGSWYVGGLSSSVSFVPAEPGSYFFRVRPHFDGTGEFTDPQTPRGYSIDTGAGAYTLRFKAGTITRLSGAGRVQTAIALSKERYADGELPLFDPSGYGTVVLANGFNFPDALAGSTLAGALSGPLLLTNQATLDHDVKVEIERLGATRVLMLGGTGALSDGVKHALEQIPGMTVDRVAGADRMATSIAIAKRALQEYDTAMPGALSTATVAFVANGMTYPDALAASPMAAYNVAPILLTRPNSIDASTLAALDDLNVHDVVILGSTSAVSANVEKALTDKLHAGHVMRIGGKDRYETAKAFAVWATGSQGATDAVGTPAISADARLAALDWRHFVLSAGWNYPDALGGGAFAGLAGRPLLLNPAGDNISPWILDVQHVLPAGSSAFLTLPAPGTTSPTDVGKVGRGYVIGGASAVGDGVWRGLDSLVGLPQSD